MYLIGGHYRQPLAFSDGELEDAQRRVYRIRDALSRLAKGQPSPDDMRIHRDEFFAALANDFNTPAALASLFEWVREANRRGEGVGDANLLEMLDVVGLGELTKLPFTADPGAIDKDFDELLKRREQARRERDFETADCIRGELLEKGWEIRDGPDGPVVYPAEGP
jgi:cysteinyl-tRNA synthetase